MTGELRYCVIDAGGLTSVTGGLDDLRREARASAPGDRLLWVTLDGADAAALPAVLDMLGLDAAEAFAAHRRPRVDLADDGWAVALKTVWYLSETRRLASGEVLLCASHRAVVTLRRGRGDPVGPARDRLAADGGLRRRGATGVAFALIDQVVAEYAEAVELLEDDVGALEAMVFSDRRADRIADIYSLIREAIAFQGAVGPLMPFAHDASRGRAGEPVRDVPAFRETAHRLLRIDAAVDRCMSLLSTVLSAHQSQIGVWQNEDMRKIASWAAIAVVPTAIAGIYGMNFQHMPELHWVFGYPLVLVVIAAVCLLLYRGFRRNGWL